MPTLPFLFFNLKTNEIMIHNVNNCHDCPLCNSDNEFGRDGCNHPLSTIQLKDNDELPNRTIHPDCPLKTIDLILTIRER